MREHSRVIRMFYILFAVVVKWQYPLVKTHLTVCSQCVLLIVYKLCLKVDLTIKPFMDTHYF